MNRKSVFKQHGMVLFLVLITFLALPVFKAYAVFLTPNRVFFDDRQRAARIIIYNKGNETQNVSFSWEHLVMEEGGALKRLAEGETHPGYRPSDPYIRYSPRRTVLRPGQDQKIRLLVQKPGDLAPGEYRSHFRVSAAPASQGQDPQIADDEDKFNLGVKLRVAKSIPLFLWQGETKIDIQIKSASIQNKPEGRVVHFEFANNSTRSIYVKTNIVCDGAAPDAPPVAQGSTRLYAEAKNISFDMNATKMDAAGCSSFTAKLMGIDDPEYANKLVAQAPVTTR